MDTVFIKDLAIDTIIGVYDWERTILQRLLLDIEMGVSIQQAAITDDVRFTVDYSVVAEELRLLIVAGEYQLIETVAVRCAEMLLAKYQLPYCAVTVYKPGAVSAAHHVGVKVIREDKSRG